MESAEISFIVCPACGYYFDERHLEICAEPAQPRGGGLRCPRCGGRITVRRPDGRHINILFSRPRV